MFGLKRSNSKIKYVHGTTDVVNGSIATQTVELSFELGFNTHKDNRSCGCVCRYAKGHWAMFLGLSLRKGTLDGVSESVATHRDTGRCVRVCRYA